MVKRRKMLIGAGSLLAGGAAATGTGAFTTMESGSRTTNVSVAGDANAFIGLEGVAPWANGDSAEGGKLALDFAGAFQYGYNGEGVNPGSTYRFDDVFKLKNAVAGENEDGDFLGSKPWVYVGTSGFHEDIDIEFYISATGNFGGKAGSPRFPYGTSITGEANEVRMNDPETFWVGVKIESTGATSIDEAGGEITVHATQDGNQGQF